MKIKKVLSMILVFTLILSLGASTVFAGNDGKIPPGQAKKIFNDITKFDWAEQAIELMFLKGFIKGYGDGIFKPQASVTNLEAIIMALRVMGWEEETRTITELPKKYKGDVVANWAVGYVALAYRKGILDDVDMMYFKPNEPAKRHEVAKYAIRAIGFEKEAQEYMKEKLSFIDAPAVPQGSVGYVYLANKLGLMQGDSQKRFNPMGVMTRAEMAVLFFRLDDKVKDDIDEEEITGEIYRIGEESITLLINDNTRQFEVDDDVRVYKNNKRIDFDDLRRGQLVKIQLEDEEVISIQVIESLDNDTIIAKYSGTVKEIKTTEPRQIALQSKTMVIMFEVLKTVKVEFKNGEGSFNEIKKEDTVTVIVDSNNRVRQINVNRNRENNGWYEEIEGELTEIDLVGTYHIWVDAEGYDLAEDAEVSVNGKGAELEDLAIGMEVIIGLEDDVVVYVEAEYDETIITGQIGRIRSNIITIRKSNGTSVSYNVADDVKIIIDGIRNPDIDDLLVGDSAEFKIVNNLITEIEVLVKLAEVEGTFISVNSKSIKINVNSQVKEYQLADVYVVNIEDYTDNLGSLVPGMKIELKLRNDEVYELNAEDNVIELEEGTIEEITTNSAGTKLTIKVGTKEYEYFIAEDAVIEIGNNDAEIAELEVDQEGDFTVLNNLIVIIEIED